MEYWLCTRDPHVNTETHALYIIEVAIGPVTGRTLYSYRSGSHVLSIFLFALILLVRVRNGVWCSVRLVLGLGIGFGLALG